MRSSLVVLVAMLSGCVVEAATTPPPPPPPVARQAPPPRPVVAARPAAAPVRALPPAIEPGYEHCCGNGAFRLEIGCGYLDLRCYQRTSSGWVRTYGRHCKEQLGMACYLNGCDNRCE